MSLNLSFDVAMEQLVIQIQAELFSRRIMSASSSEPLSVSVDETQQLRIKSAPSFKTPSVYHASADGIDANLLVLLHGLGDTATPFGQLGRSLNLPQTATLAISGPESIPYLLPDEKGYQWHKSFDDLGELIEHPNPTSAVAFLDGCLKHLVDICGWRYEEIHLFGFAQGGSVAGELGLALARDGRRLGSIVSVCGALYSFPTSSTTPAATPVLVFDRTSPAQTRATTDSDVKAWRRGFARVVHEVVERSAPSAGMPANKEEWGRIMAFWADVLQRRMPDGLYAVRR
jgi:predicted esterase